MLCGSLHESVSRDSPPSAEEKRNGGLNGQASPHIPEAAESPINCRKRSFPKYAAPEEEEELHIKRQSMEQDEGPISLVLSKVRGIHLASTQFCAYNYSGKQETLYQK